MILKILIATLVTMLLFPELALAQEPLSLDAVKVSMDNLWILVAAFLVFIMQAGFAMVEAGFTRAKNATNIMMKNLMDFSIGALVYWIFGFGLMFGATYYGIFGTSNFLGKIDVSRLGLNVDSAAFVLFQTMFAATAATIVSGAMAERTKFAAYVVYSFFISLFIYPVVGHWIWNPEGWLAKLGMIDFAGSTVVHSLGGWAALLGAYFLGPRIGKYGKDGKPNAIPGHSITLAALGVFLLWFGWFGFNPGSTLSATDPRIATIAVNTNLAAAAGAFASMVLTWLRYGKTDVSMTLNGALAGLVAVTAGAHTFNAVGSILTGTIAGLVVVFAIEFFDHVLKIDDPVGAISVHGVCGMIGTLLVGFLSVDSGLLYGHGLRQLYVQAIGVVSVFLWTALSAGLLFYTIKSTIGLRVSAEEEIEGLDIGEHGLVAYSDFVLYGVEDFPAAETGKPALAAENFGKNAR